MIVREKDLEKFQEFEHYGVQGIKWGVRRSVNKGVSNVKDSYNRSMANYHDGKSNYYTYAKNKHKNIANNSNSNITKSFNEAMSKRYDKLNKKHIEIGEKYIRRLSADNTKVVISIRDIPTMTGGYRYIGPKLVAMNK